MKLPLQFQIRFMRRFWGIEPGSAVTHPVGHYLRAPFSLMRANAEQTNFVGFGSFAHILKIAEPRYLAKIAKSVVAGIAVYMVDMLRRPFTSDMRPRKSMRELFSVVYGYGPIPSRLSGPRRLAYKIWSPFMRKPCKDTCGRIVAKRRPQMFNGAWWINCHDNAFTIGGLK